LSEFWLLDKTTSGHVASRFDDPPDLRAKAEYVRRNGLSGVMFWELSGDTPESELIRAIAES
jgi:chitinase